MVNFEHISNISGVSVFDFEHVSKNEKETLQGVKYVQS